MLNDAEKFGYISIVGSIVVLLVTPYLIRLIHAYPFIFGMNMFVIPFFVIGIIAIAMGKFMLGSLGAALSLLFAYAGIEVSVWRLLQPMLLP